MNNLQVFNSSDFGQVRTVEENGNILFCGRDVATALGYKDSNNALKQHCRGVVKRHPITDQLGRTQQARFIGEPDLYRLVASSKLPAAAKFEAWIFDDVLPTIRRHGMYATDQKIEDMLLDPDTMIATLQALKQERAKRRELEAQVEADKPKTQFYDAVADSDTCIPVGELAKLLKANGIDTGARRLFKWLRDNGWLMRRRGDDWNMPTQKAMNLELFEIKETVISHPDTGYWRINRTPKVTGKGQQFFMSKFFEEMTA